jgi:predicted helicase
MNFLSYLSDISEIYRTNDYLEHSYRTPFQNMLGEFCNENIKADFKIIHEPRRKEFGAPDFKVIDKANNVIGYIECKDIDKDISREIKTKQMEKYISISNNIILTNYIDFILIKNGSIVKKVSLVELSSLQKKKFGKEDNEAVNDLLINFFISKPELINDSNKLSTELASKTKILKELIIQELHDKEENPFIKFYSVFKSTIIDDLSIKDFADMYAQIIGIGLLFFRLSKDEILSRDNILSKIPQYIPLLKDFFPNASFDEWSNDVIWILDDILYLLNSIDKTYIKKSLSYKEMSIIDSREENLQDPFINFYELFLTVYDKKTKLARGVFYTPEAVVSFIIRSIDILIKTRIGIKQGYLDSSLKVLDFASGTGTFILAMIDYIYKVLFQTGKKKLFDSEVREHILENVYGFELLVVPYIISHLRIHEYLESNNFIYHGEHKERAEIYLTNTLHNEVMHQTNFLKNFDNESQLATTVKNSKDIIVIMGNPPYSNYSQNKSKNTNGEKTWIGNLLDDYKPSGETKLNLDDDYIKFIRFACWKMENIQQGVIGIVTNNSFLNGITHRKMRKYLLDNFSEIYILNLHGNVNIGEKCPDGSLDSNVFAIKDAGICISFFVKKKKKEVCKLYYADLYGKKTDKYKYLYANDVSSVPFSLINYHEFNDNFFSTRWGMRKSDIKGEDFLFKDGLNFFTEKKAVSLISEYGNYWGIKDIFSFVGTGVKTERDTISIHYTKKSIGKVVDDFYSLSEKEIRGKYLLGEDSRDWKVEKAKQDIINSNKDETFYKVIEYRPFDYRYTFYTGTSKGFIGTPGLELAKNFDKENIGLIVKRQSKPNAHYTYFFVTKTIFESCLFEATYGNSMCAPLYILDHDSLVDSRTINYTPDFLSFIHTAYPNLNELEIFSYVYSIFYSNTYRARYSELLKIDFPRIPFIKDTSKFTKLSLLGKRLIDLHTLSELPNESKCTFDIPNPNYSVLKAEWNDSKIFLNDSTCFGNVSDEVWKYEIGGYQVLSKWLDYRQKNGYVLHNNDLKTFISIVDILYETIDIQNQIDDLLEDEIQGL